MNFIESIKKNIEILILILISFSPLISQKSKAIIVLGYLILNYKYLLSYDKEKFKVLLFSLTVFLVGFMLDLKNVSSLIELDLLGLWFPMCFLSGYIISEKYSLLVFFSKIDKVVFLLAILSLVGVFTYTFIPNVVQKLPIYEYYHTTHRTAYIFNILTNSPSGVLARNAGIAWEPGSFQFLLNLGLYSYLRVEREPKYFRIALYTIAIISTKSTAGIIIFCSILIKLLINERKARYLFVLIVFVSFGFIYNEISYQITYKLFGSSSFNIRLDPLLTALKLGCKNLFGLGNVGFKSYYKNGLIPPWDSVGQIVARYGYILFVYLFIRLFKNLRHDVVLLIIILITFGSQNIWFFPLVTVFYFLSYKSDFRRVI